ncbi:MAG: hypothetical protein JWM63_340 [Gammaproteobacteria bacterium]|nr:hypothetical protein [Gammaproteobacteria bacterium]
MHQGTRDRHALLLTAGQLVYGAVKSVTKTYFSEHGGTAPTRVGTSHPVQLEHETHVLLNIERWDEVEELIDESDVRAPEQCARGLGQRRNVTAAELHDAAVGSIDAADYIQQGRFAGAATADDGNRRAVLNLRIRMIEHAMNALAFAKATTELPENKHRPLLYENPPPPAEPAAQAGQQVPGLVGIAPLPYTARQRVPPLARHRLHTPKVAVSRPT